MYNPLTGLLVLGVAMSALSYKLYLDGSPPKFVWLTGVVGGLALLLAFRTLKNHARGDGL